MAEAKRTKLECSSQTSIQTFSICSSKGLSFCGMPLAQPLAQASWIMAVAALSVVSLVSAMVFSNRSQCPSTHCVAWQPRQVACMFSCRLAISSSEMRMSELNVPSKWVGSGMPSLLGGVALVTSLGCGWA
jgi:hypothetical protein